MMRTAGGGRRGTGGAGLIVDRRWQPTRPIRPRTAHLQLLAGVAGALAVGWVLTTVGRAGGDGVPARAIMLIAGLALAALALALAGRRGV
jgi:hypothetical protein